MTKSQCLILTINAGSSSVKYSVFDTATNQQVVHAEMERVPSVEDAVRRIPALLQAHRVKELAAIGHRVAHGGAKFREPQLIDASVIAAIEDCVPLAPLHNPPALAGIKAASDAWPGVAQVAVFDTAFHQTIPERAFTYAVPDEWRKAGLRRYGFHGTSHKYVMLRVAEELRTPAAELRIISCHLGNGASVCAIERGMSVDTSMGMTSLEGLVMGTRSGDVDPGVFGYLHRTLGLSIEQIEDALYRNSGLTALSGIGNDMRDIEKRAAEGDKQAQLAIQVYAYHARKYIAAYAGVMNGVDVIAFTGGIGENSASMRKRICDRLDYLGLDFDDDKNVGVKLADSDAPQIQAGHSRVRVVVTRTREQWMIAQEAAQLLARRKAPADALPPIPIAVSAHHVHLTQQAVEQLFGKGHQLRIRNQLSQPGFWAAEETVDVAGPRGEIRTVRVLGPCREANQIEIAETEAFKLGVDVPVRLSGDTKGTPTVTLRGAAGSLTTDGLIVAKRHIHMNTKDAETLGLHHGDQVEVAVRGGDRELSFRNVVIRVDPRVITEMHIDTDEANAAHLPHRASGELIYAPLKGCTANITCCEGATCLAGHSCCLKNPDTKEAA
jgi:acetate kinase